jgi:glycerophosphoryl diester phosphodiesterase
VEGHRAAVIGHRGASGYRPEHTLASYPLALRQCADFIEPDIVSSKDGAGRAPRERDRRHHKRGGAFVVREPQTTKVIDGVSVTGWLTEDFALTELRTLRARERLPQIRPTNAAYDGRYPIPTLDEVVDLARHSRTCSGKPVGVTPETKLPSHFASIGLPLEPRLLAALTTAGLNHLHAPVIIQSFETENLKGAQQVT